MSWIDDRLKQREDAYRRSVLIDGGAEKTFNALWGAIASLVEEAKSKNIPVFTNGTPYERTLALSVPPRVGETYSSPKQLDIRLVKENKAIMAGGVKLDLDLCEDDVICIKRNGVLVSIGDLAASILDEFLFPEFAKSKS